MKSEAGPSHVTDSSNHPHDTRVKVTLVARPLLTPVAQYSRAERVFILEHHFAFKSFAVVREAFSSAYPDKVVPTKTQLTD
jgi:hypothetical protein